MTRGQYRRGKIVILRKFLKITFLVITVQIDKDSLTQYPWKS